MGSDDTGDELRFGVGSEVMGDNDGEFVGLDVTGDLLGFLEEGRSVTGERLGEFVGSEETGDAVGDDEGGGVKNPISGSETIQ